MLSKKFRFLKHVYCCNNFPIGQFALIERHEYKLCFVYIVVCVMKFILVPETNATQKEYIGFLVELLVFNLYGKIQHNKGSKILI